MKWLVTGDLHGSADRFKNYVGVYDDNPSEVAVIVLVMLELITLWTTVTINSKRN